MWSDMEKGLLIVLSGPSGVGKDTVLKGVMKRDSGLKKSISVTTRAPRTGEVDGVHYHFISREKYDEMLADGDFLEHESVHGNCYATPASYVESIRKEGKDAVLVIDVKGGLSVKSRLPEAVLIFILPGSMEGLLQRLSGRNTDAPEVIEKRMKNAPGEIEKALEYDYAVVNDDLEECVGRVLEIIAALRGKNTEKAEKYCVKNNMTYIKNLIGGGK